VTEDRISSAADRLRELEASGATLDDILNGEIGRRWIEEDCGGDRKIAARAFRRVHPSARIVTSRRGSCAPGHRRRSGADIEALVEEGVRG
jgi:hypothetical protein